MRYQLSINKYKNVDKEQFKDTKTFIVYSTNINDIYRKSAIHVRKRKIIIVANVVATDVLSYKKREPVKTELFISSGKLNISTFSSYNHTLLIQKNARSKRTCYFVMNIPNKCEPQQIVFNHFMRNLYQ